MVHKEAYMLKLLESLKEKIMTHPETGVTVEELQALNSLMYPWHPVCEPPNREQYLKNNGYFIVTDGNRVYHAYFNIYDPNKSFCKCDLIQHDTMIPDKCATMWTELPDIETARIQSQNTR